MKFESKYDIGCLVEYKGPDTEKDGINVFGKITSVSFWKCDAVNVTCAYDMERVNGGQTDNRVPERDIIKYYKDL